MSSRHLIVLALFFESAVTAQVPSPMHITVTTDKADYIIGETIQITVVATSVEADTVSLCWNDGCQATYIIDGHREPIFCIEILTCIQLAPFESASWGFSHESTGLELGSHEVIGEVISYGFSDPWYITLNLPVFADFSSDIQSGCAPLEVQFIDQSQGSPASWYWNFGDGEFSNEQNPKQEYKFGWTY